MSFRIEGVTQQRPPSVDALARSLAGGGSTLPHPLLVDVARRAIASGDVDGAADEAAAVERALLRRVVNATGVLLHTNLGRAPLGVQPSVGYSNLELDLVAGRRGSRRDRAGALLARLTGAESALVVNNGAAAVLLALAALAPGRGVAVSRGEAVEIGGGFRIPEVCAQSGARLVEVGTTNRTRVDDHAAVDGDVALHLKVHRSNYRITGFVEDAPVRALVAGCTAPVVVDLGSGLLDAACPWLPDGPPPWLRDEPAARQTLADGAALVTFSGDKLLGGPQAGILAGGADLVDACARHPLYRALRPGSLVLAALEQVALAYLRRDLGALPFWRLASTPVDDLRRRAAALGVGDVVDTDAVTGGGTLPGVTIASAGVAVEGDRTAALRASDPPVIARVVDDRTVCDLRAVDPADDAVLAAALLKSGR
jgi:L-seryl-tRNA(Ser) seleniumtransferase